MISIPLIDKLPRCQKIYEHPLYRENFVKLQEFEKDRIFCRHSFEHFLDVARIAYIINLEQNLGIEREIIYAAALLHDIGRAMQYENAVPHDKAGAEISELILSDCGFLDDEKRMIINAILSHRKGNDEGDKLSSIIYTADKTSRQCYMCKAQKDCNWTMEKRNLEIYI